ncbi:palmitoyl-acyl carrier protein thioesterase, chloroplastic-like [Punica granatum]|uniref:Acyl-[acyl-carrier-protein] hydrolase n=1 Tax=Punica granatum TaxID=22663 RepID=A0A6P8CIH0_PUNGR|nr:palmitoyl-acyl carrier protein thioesterase, chloroplastic-like [Punica granatum]
MVATAAASPFFPLPSPNYPAKATKHGNGNLQVKADAQAHPKINGSFVGSMTCPETAKADDSTPSPPPKTSLYDRLPDWSMLLAAITSIFMAARKQQLMTLDQKLRRPGMFIDPFGLGGIVQDGLVFRQNFTIRSYEIGADQTASIETIMNQLQEAALSHFMTAGLIFDGFGSTREMTKRNLIWVVTKMQVLVDRYPTWGDVVQVDAWLSASGRNGMRIDWLVRDVKTEETRTRASSVWVMMNKLTRKLSKIPKEVRGEIEPHLLNSAPVVDEDSRKLPKLDAKTADYVLSGLTPRWSDLDVNQHVNNVKYIGWILESTPQTILETHDLLAITLEYRRECGRDSVRQSLTKISGDGAEKSRKVEFKHLLQLETGHEIVRARTEWKPKESNNNGHLGEFFTECT